VDASIISALAALTGAAVGGLTSGIANWLNHRSQVRAHWLLHERNRRQVRYRDFIEEAAKCYIDALQHDEPDIPGPVGIYAKLSRMRALSSKPVVLNPDPTMNVKVSALRCILEDVPSISTVAPSLSPNSATAERNASRLSGAMKYSTVTSTGPRSASAWISNIGAGQCIDGARSTPDPA
jgi:hypothetical protein